MISKCSFLLVIFLWARRGVSLAKASSDRQQYWSQRRAYQDRSLYSLQHFSECISNFQAADVNQDEQLSREEFTIFAQLQLNQDAPVPFDELDAALVSIFLADACLCSDPGCCAGENAHIDFNPHKTDFLESIFFVCKSFEELAIETSFFPTVQPSTAPSTSISPSKDTQEVVQASLIGDVKNPDDAKQEGAAMSEAQKAILTLSLFCISFLIVIVMTFLFVQGAVAKRKNEQQPTVAAVLDSPEKDNSTAWRDGDGASQGLLNLPNQGTWPASSPSAMGDEENPEASPKSLSSDPISTTAILASQKKIPLKNRLQQFLAAGWNGPIVPERNQGESPSSKDGDSMAMQYPASPMSLQSIEMSSPERASMRVPQNLSPIPFRHGKLRDDTPMIVTPSRRSLVPFGQQGLAHGSPRERWHNDKLSGSSKGKRFSHPSTAKRGLEASSTRKSSKKPNLNATPIKPKTISFSVQHDQTPLETPMAQNLKKGEESSAEDHDLLTRTGARKLPSLADHLGQTPKTPNTLKDSSYLSEMDLEPTPVESPPLSKPEGGTDSNVLVTRSVARVSRSLADELGKTPHTERTEAVEDESPFYTPATSKYYTPTENSEGNPGKFSEKDGDSIQAVNMMTRSVARVGPSLADDLGKTPRTITKPSSPNSRLPSPVRDSLSDSRTKHDKTDADGLKPNLSDLQNLDTDLIDPKDDGTLVKSNASETSLTMDTPHILTPRPTNGERNGQTTTGGRPSSTKRSISGGNIFQFFPNSLKKATPTKNSQERSQEEESYSSPMESIVLYQPPQLSTTKATAYDVRLQYNGHPFGESDVSEKEGESSLDREAEASFDHGAESSMDREFESSMEHDAEHEEGFHTDTGSYASSGFFERMSPLRDPPKQEIALSSPSSEIPSPKGESDEADAALFDTDNEHEIEFQTDRDASLDINTDNEHEIEFQTDRDASLDINTDNEHEIEFQTDRDTSLENEMDAPFSHPKHLLQVLGSIHKKNHSPSLVRAGDYEDDTYPNEENAGFHQGVNLVHAFNTPIKRSPLRESSGNRRLSTRSQKSGIRKASIASPDPPGRLSDARGPIHGTPSRPSTVSENEIVFRLEGEQDDDHHDLVDDLEAQIQSPEHLFQVIDSIHRYHMSKEQHRSSERGGPAPWWSDDDGE